MNFKPLIIVSAMTLVLNACGSSSSSTTTEDTGGNISITTVSGGTLSLTGSYASACYDNGGTFQIDTHTWTGANLTYNQKTYTASGCATLATSTDLFTATAVAGSNSAISSWVDGMSTTTTAPTAADASGPLSDTEAYTAITVTIVTADGSSGISVGTVATTFYIVDDTGTSLILYRDDSATTATTADPLLQ